MSVFEFVRHKNEKKYVKYLLWGKEKTLKEMCIYVPKRYNACKTHFMQKKKDKITIFECFWGCYVEKREKACKLLYMGKRKEITRNM